MSPAFIICVYFSLQFVTGIKYTWSNGTNSLPVEDHEDHDYVDDHERKYEFFGQIEANLRNEKKAIPGETTTTERSTTQPTPDDKAMDEQKTNITGTSPKTPNEKEIVKQLKAYATEASTRFSESL